MLATATEIKNNFGKYLKLVTEDDKEVIITKNNQRVARLVPYISDADRYFTIRENAVDYSYHKMRVSYEEFMHIYDNSTCRMEFINGEIYVMTSPNMTHQVLLGKIYIIFSQVFKDKKCRPLISPFDVHFKKQNIKDPDVIQPDLFIACDVEGNVNEKDRYMGTPTLTLEILSSTTKNRDMVYKLNTYLTSGVSEYWIVEPQKQEIIVYSFKDYSIDKMEIYKKGEIAKSEHFDNLTVNINELFEF